MVFFPVFCTAFFILVIIFLVMAVPFVAHERLDPEFKYSGIFITLGILWYIFWFAVAIGAGAAAGIH